MNHEYYEWYEGNVIRGFFVEMLWNKTFDHINTLLISSKTVDGLEYVSDKLISETMKMAMRIEKGE